jgi:hypothetical protein
MRDAGLLRDGGDGQCAGVVLRDQSTRSVEDAVSRRGVVVGGYWRHIMTRYAMLNAPPPANPNSDVTVATAASRGRKFAEPTRHLDERHGQQQIAIEADESLRAASPPHQAGVHIHPERVNERGDGREARAVDEGSRQAQTTGASHAKTVIRWADPPPPRDGGTKPNLAKLTIARQIASIVVAVWRVGEAYDPKRLESASNSG